MPAPSPSARRLPALFRFALSPLPRAPLALALNAVAASIAQRSPGIFSRLGEHAGKRFLIEATDLPFAFVIEPRNGKPRVAVEAAGTAAAADARIAGPLAALLGLLHGTFDGDALFFSRDIVVEGDVSAVLALRNALDDAEIDLFVELAALFGPLAGGVQALATPPLLLLQRLTDLALTRPRSSAR